MVFFPSCFHILYYTLSILFFVWFCGAGDQTQEIANDRQSKDWTPTACCVFTAIPLVSSALSVLFRENSDCIILSVLMSPWDINYLLSVTSYSLKEPPLLS